MSPSLSLGNKAAAGCPFSQGEKKKKKKVAVAATTAVTAREGDMENSKSDKQCWHYNKDVAN